MGAYGLAVGEGKARCPPLPPLKKKLCRKRNTEYALARAPSFHPHFVAKSLGVKTKKTLKVINAMH